MLNNKSIMEVLYPSFDMIGLSEKELKTLDSKEEKEFTQKWTKKLNKILKEIPQRIEEFKNM